MPQANAVPSPQSVRLRRFFAARVRPLADRASPHGYQLRALRSTIDSAGLAPLPRRTAAWPARYGSVRGVWMRAPGASSATGAVLYLHGGGFVFGSPRSHRTLAYQISRASGLPVFLLDYRRAPEHPFPAAADDALAAYRMLLDRGFPASRLTVAGDSAGGHLAAGLLADLTRDGLPRPAAAFLESPWLDLGMTETWQRDRAERDPFLSPAYAEKCRRAYAPAVPVTHSRLDVLGADKTGWPPLLVQVGGTEAIQGDSQRIADSVAGAGGSATLQVWPGQIHVFQAFADFLPEAKRALRFAGSFLHDAVTC